MTNQSTALSLTVVEKEVSFIPFGSDERDPSNVIRLSVALVKKFLAPKTKQGHEIDDAQAMKFVMLNKARRLNPWEGDSYCVGYDTKEGPQFTLITAHQAFLKRAEVNPSFDGLQSGVVVKEKDGRIVELEGDFYSGDQTVVGGWAKVKVKTQSWPWYKKLRLEDYRKPFGVWLTNPNGMIVKCAEADALRSAFPTTIGGMYLREEIEAQVVSATVLPATQSRLVNRQKTLPATPSVTEGSGPAPENSAVARPSESPVTSSPAVEEPKAKRSGRGVQGSPPVAPVQVEVPPVQEGPDPFAEGAGTPPEETPVEDVIEPIEPHDDPAEMTTRIRNALRGLNLSETSLIDWCRDKGLMSEKQGYISAMNGSKLRGICEKWPLVVEEMRAPV